VNIILARFRHLQYI